MPSRYDDARTYARIPGDVLRVAILLIAGARRDLIGHDLAAAVPAHLATANAAVAERFGVRGEEVSATTLRAANADIAAIGMHCAHRRFLR
jgi:hypothetical protein